MNVPERHLAAILSADAVGYSRLMAADEAGTIRAITACRELIGRLVSGHRGRVVDSPGDNILAEFRTALDAVTCAVEIQRALHATNADLPKDRRMVFRIGVHLGDIASEGANIYGTGVNVAARLEALADPGGICISSEVYGQVQSKLALGYDDLGEQSVKNIPTPVRVYAVRLDKKADRQPRAAAARWGKLRIVAVTAVGALLAVAAMLWLSWPAPIGLVLDLAGVGSLPENPPLPDKPSLVVLPFDNLSGDPEQDYFADGLVEDLTTDLSQNPFLFVIARNSAFTYKGKAVRVEDVGRELGVRYVVEGSVRRIENRVRINAQLIDAASGLHLWSERYDRELADIFAVQTEIVSALLDSVGVEVMVSERNRARRKTRDLNAYDAMWKGIHYLSLLSRAGNAEARRWAERAIALDPGYADAHAIVAVTYNTEHMMGWNLDPTAVQRAAESTRRCIELDPKLAQCRSAAAGVELGNGNFTAAVREAEKAVELAPGFFAGHMILGLTLGRVGQPLRALESAQRAIRLDPSGGPVAGVLGMVNFRAGRDGQAIELFERMRSSYPDALPARVILASIAEAAGDRGRAREILEEILAINPDLTVAKIPRVGALRALGPSKITEIQDNLRSAGFPDNAE